ncbi:MAG: CHAT domain-containing protein, partial [Planctomycetales bacterium]|nr:CHAT domain-containing protein [Planctomycetales bacterium]
PFEKLWYVPYELLPDGDGRALQPWIENHRVTYVPTLGSYQVAFNNKPVIRDTVGLYSMFFSTDRQRNEELAASLGADEVNHHSVSLYQKVTIPSSQLLRLRTDRLWIASEIDMTAGWESVSVPLAIGKHESLGGWLEMPGRGVKQVVFAGSATSIRTGNLLNGNDIFLPACATMLSGSQSVLLSRWPVGGISAANVMQRYLEEETEVPASEALRRSVLAMWAERYLTSAEPSLLPVGREGAQLTSGQHPVLWSSYMS